MVVIEGRVKPRGRLSLAVIKLIEYPHPNSSHFQHLKSLHMFVCSDQVIHLAVISLDARPATAAIK